MLFSRETRAEFKNYKTITNRLLLVNILAVTFIINVKFTHKKGFWEFEKCVIGWIQNIIYWHKIKTKQINIINKSLKIYITLLINICVVLERIDRKEIKYIYIYSMTYILNNIKFILTKYYSLQRLCDNIHLFWPVSLRHLSAVHNETPFPLICNTCSGCLTAVVLTKWRNQFFCIR